MKAKRIAWSALSVAFLILAITTVVRWFILPNRICLENRTGEDVANVRVRVKGSDSEVRQEEEPLWRNGTELCIRARVGHNRVAVMWEDLGGVQRRSEEKTFDLWFRETIVVAVSKEGRLTVIQSP